MVASVATTTNTSSIDEGLKKYVDSQTAATKTNGNQTSLGDNVQAYFKLLFAQLQNQDPNDPVDNKDMFTQIAILTQTAGVAKTNQLLQSLVDANSAGAGGAGGGSGLFDYLNKVVDVKSDTIPLRQDGANFTFNSSVALANAKVTITNAGGDEIFSSELQTKNGKNEFAWDGKNSGGAQQPVGNYKVKVELVKSDGKTESLPVYVAGLVSSINVQDKTKPTATINGLDYAIADIGSVYNVDTSTPINPTNSIDYSNYLNKIVSVNTDGVRFTSGASTNPFILYNAEANSQYGVRVLNTTSGAEVYSATTPASTGTKIDQFVWDGKKTNGQLASDGVYQVRIDKIQNGSFVPVQTFTKGTISSVNLSGQSPQILVNGVYQDVANITEFAVK